MDQTRPPADVRRLKARQPIRPLSGTVQVPGDSGISHCALIVAGLAIGETEITGLLGTDSVRHMGKAMQALGAEVSREAPGAWRVSGRGIGGLRGPADVLHAGGSSIGAQLLCGVLASHDLFAVVTGDASLRDHPMQGLLGPLQACGARIQARDGGRLPLAIQGARDALPLEHRLPADSGPIKSALLLAGLNARGWTRIEETGPTHDHSERMLRHFGAEVLAEPAGAHRAVRLLGQPELRAAAVDVPGDPSLAALPLVAALIVPGSVVTVQGIGLNPMRTGLFALLREMGAQLEVTHERLAGNEPVGDVTATYTGLRGVDVPADRMPDRDGEHPILAVAAACAAGRTRMRGLGAAPRNHLAAMLTAIGAWVEVEGNDMAVYGGAALPGGCRVPAHGDPRVAMGALVLGQAAAEPVEVDGAACIEASFPGFMALMSGLGANIR